MSGLILDHDSLLACTTKDDFITLLQSQKVGNSLLLDGLNNPNCAYEVSEGVGVSIRTDDLNTDTPLFTYTNCKIPKHVVFDFSANTTYMLHASLVAVCSPTVKYTIFSVVDGHYYNSGSSGGDGVFADNGNTTLLTWDGTSRTKVSHRVELHLPDDTPNCFTAGETTCDLQFHCYYTYKGYTTLPIYISEFLMVF